MFLLDTNIVSETRNPAKGNRGVIEWANSALRSRCFVSVITIMEIELGAKRVLHRGDQTQYDRLLGWLNDTVIPSFGERILAVDLTVARRCASLHVPDPKSERDAFIAATALVHGLTVVTRNIQDFATTGAKLFNPWRD